MFCSIGPSTAAMGGAFDFSSSSMRAAYLVLPDGGKYSKSKVPGKLEQYATDHAHDWYQYFNGQGMQIHNGMLYLVTGCHKCRSWANACYSHTATSRAVSLNLSVAGGGVNVGGTLYCKWEVQSDSPVHRRSLPEPPHVEPQRVEPPPPTNPSRDPNLPEPAENQTIFLHGYSISVRDLSDVLVKTHLKSPVKPLVKIDEGTLKPPRFESKSRVPYGATHRSSTTPSATETGTSGTVQVSSLFSCYKS